MPFRQEQFVNGEFYHIIVRRIGNDLLFKDINDYFRGIFSIYEFNNANPVNITKRRKEINAFKKLVKNKTGLGPSSTQLSQGRTLIQTLKMPDNRELLVEVVVFALMPNHVHLLVRQLEDGGITKFMSKFGTGYAGYFKEKYKVKRKGYFFQGRFTAVHIKNDRQLKAVFVYIHINAISLIEPKWKERGIKNPDKVIKFLENEFRWSSCFDYIGKKNFPSVTEREFILEVMGGEQGCKDAIENWIRYKGEIKEYSNLALE